MQPTLFSSNHLTVSQLTFRIRKLLESDPTLQDVWVEGEISNLSRPASGHVYFTLKDKNASIRCVMWKTSAARLQISMREGAAIEAHGKIEVYDPQGQYQLIVNIVQPKGEGALYQEFLRLKAKLEAEGLFDMERKRPIPALPRTIGIVTSETGAALRDMLNTLRRRLPLVRVILAPSPVQGTEAPAALVRALDSLNRQNPDVILLARGGGSIEDLWAFNDEGVVRAVVDSRTPVICGVGHETDFSLCDFAADLRAPTPTAAAELATQVTLIDLQALVTSFTSRLFTSTLNLIVEQKTAISTWIARIRYVSPQRRIQLDAQRVDDLSRRGLSALTHRFILCSACFEGM
jgi:exodeoxyribonuclease VII large subunit